MNALYRMVVVRYIHSRHDRLVLFEILYPLRYQHILHPLTGCLPAPLLRHLLLTLTIFAFDRLLHRHVLRLSLLIGGAVAYCVVGIATLNADWLVFFPEDSGHVLSLLLLFGNSGYCVGGFRAAVVVDYRAETLLQYGVQIVLSVVHSDNYRNLFLIFNSKTIHLTIFIQNNNKIN